MGLKAATYYLKQGYFDVKFLLMALRLLFCSMVCTLVFAGMAWGGNLMVLVDTGTEMPIADIRDGRVVGGMQKDLGEALAAQLGRKAEFIALPRRRIAEALDSGKADVLCMYLPIWLPGDFDWSQGFFPIVEVVISDRSVAQPHTLKDLAGQAVGTLLGYSYPEMEQALGAGFIREDAPSAEDNLRKMSVGRIHYASTTTSYLAYQIKTMPLNLNAPLLAKAYHTQCAVSRHGHVMIGQLNQAITRIVKDGGLNLILAHYQ